MDNQDTFAFLFIAHGTKSKNIDKKCCFRAINTLLFVLIWHLNSTSITIFTLFLKVQISTIIRMD